MLKNYFITALNNLIKNKLYSAINIIGLAVGISAFLLLTLYVQDELSYDKHWKKADLIYRINSRVNFVPSLDSPFPLSSPLLLPALKKYFHQEIEFGTRVNERTGEIKAGDESYSGSISFVDKEFIDIFQCEVISGNLAMTLQSPGNIALSQETATHYFGKKDPVGKILTFVRNNGQEEQYKVMAVFRFLSPNTVLNIPGFTLYGVEEADSSDWFSFELQTYIRFHETVDVKKFIDRLPDFINQNVHSSNMNFGRGTKMSSFINYLTQKMSDIYFSDLQETLTDQPTKKGNRAVITVFIIISVLVLIIGSVNFVILTTAKASQRAREVAMRKVVGARFRQLLFQFLGESILITSTAFILALALAEIFLPVFELIVNKKLAIPYTSPLSLFFAILLILLIGLLGGLYPSFILSGFSPNQALKANKTTEAVGSTVLRNILIIFQFTASIALIIATITAFYQLQYTYKHDPGFNPENLLVVEGIGRPDIGQYRNTLKQELLKLPGVVNVGLSSLQPKLLGEVDQSLFTLRRNTDDSISQQPKLFANMKVCYNFFETYKIPLLSGRYFLKGMDQEETDKVTSNPQKVTDKSIIINLEAAKQFGFHSADDAPGKVLYSGDQGSPTNKEFTIIGVVADSQFRGLRTRPAPELYQLSPDATHFLAVRYRGDYQTMVKEVRHVWNNVVGDYLFRDSNVKLNMLATFSQEAQENKALMAFSLLSVFIACMGLYGMASFTVERRVKEIGMRKVMGAKVKDIVKLLGWSFLKPVLIANILAWPVAIFAMQNWLERFPYRFNPLFMIPICLVSGFIALVIAWFTVAGNTSRVAKSKPIKALRYE